MGCSTKQSSSQMMSFIDILCSCSSQWQLLWVPRVLFIHADINIQGDYAINWGRCNPNIHICPARSPLMACVNAWELSFLDDVLLFTIERSSKVRSKQCVRSKETYQGRGNETNQWNLALNGNHANCTGKKELVGLQPHLIASDTAMSVRKWLFFSTKFPKEAFICCAMFGGFGLLIGRRFGFRWEHKKPTEHGSDTERHDPWYLVVFSVLNG